MPHQLLLLTRQIPHLTAFSCDLLTSCWSSFSARWPAAISLVIAPLKSTRVLDNTRELCVWPESSATKKRLQVNNISACLQWGAMGGRVWVWGMCRILWLHWIWCVCRDVVWGCDSLIRQEWQHLRHVSYWSQEFHSDTQNQNSAVCVKSSPQDKSHTARLKYTLCFYLLKCT